MVINPKNINKLGTFFSFRRLENPRKMTKTEDDALGYHQATIDLGLSVMGIIGAIEISLRNVIVEEMDAHFGKGKWLKANADGFYWEEDDRKLIENASDKAYMATLKRLPARKQRVIKSDLKRQTAGLVAGQRSELWKTIRPPIFTDDDLIPSFTLLFWKRLYIEHYNNILWEPVLHRTFSRNQLGSSMAKPMDRRTVYRHLDKIHGSRNRMAHYEPVLGGRFTATMDSIKFITQHLGTDQPGHGAPLASFLASRIADAEAREKNLR